MPRSPGLTLALASAWALSGCGRVGFDDLTLSNEGQGNAGQTHTGGSIGSSLAGSGGAASSAGGTSGGAASGGSSTGGTPMSGGAGGSPMGGSATSGGTAGASGSSAGGTSTGGVPSTGGVAMMIDGGGVLVGCADGEREGFLSLSTHPDIAACSGGFSVPGVRGLVTPTCARAGGDDGADPNGIGCSALDLCAAGWHLCADAAEVAAKSPTGCNDSAPGPELAFYATAQAGAGQAHCGASGNDDVYGCGTLGGAPDPSCAPLDRWSASRCTGLGLPWSCGTQNDAEALNLVKSDATAGGVLCCRD